MKAALIIAKFVIALGDIIAVVVTGSLGYAVYCEQMGRSGIGSGAIATIMGILWIPVLAILLLALQILRKLVNKQTGAAPGS